MALPSDFLSFLPVSFLQPSLKLKQPSPGGPSPQTAIQPQLQAQGIHLAQPNLGAYRGGSLPNVNQMVGSNSIDLQVGNSTPFCSSL